MSHPPDPVTQAYFSDSFETLAARLTQAQHQVISCVHAACPPAWFKLMLACRRRGLCVTLIVPAIELNLKAALAWERLTALGGQLVWLAADSPRLETSACVIDQTILISGNFCDFKRTAALDFSGIVIQDQTQIVADCLQGLHRLLPARTGTDCPDPLPGPERASAAEAHQLVTQQAQTAQVPAWQLGLLAEQAMALDLDIADMHRKINTFDRQQDHALGDLLRQFLDFKQRYLTQLQHQFGGEHAQSQAQAAQADFEQFQHREIGQDPSPAAQPLDLQQQEEIKSLYRKLAMLCHPDRVEEAHKLQAQTLFQQLQTSYRNSDFSALQTLELQLNQAQVLEGVTRTGSAAGREQQLAKLLDQLERQQLTRRLILESPTWRTLSSQSNWTLWFTQQARFLETEIERYSQALDVALQPPA